MIKEMINPKELFEDVQEILNDFREQNTATVLTTDIIRKHQGNYYNANAKANKSWNALFGKFLKNNQERLNIKEIRSKVSTKDDNGNETSCSEWKIL